MVDFSALLGGGGPLEWKEVVTEDGQFRFEMPGGSKPYAVAGGVVNYGSSGEIKGTTISFSCTFNPVDTSDPAQVFDGSLGYMRKRGEVREVKELTLGGHPGRAAIAESGGGFFGGPKNVQFMRMFLMPGQMVTIQAVWMGAATEAPTQLIERYLESLTFRGEPAVVAGAAPAPTSAPPASAPPPPASVPPASAPPPPASAPPAPVGGFAPPAPAPSPAAAAPGGDPRVRAELERLGADFQVTAEGDFEIRFPPRSVMIGSAVTTYDQLSFRRVWTVVARYPGPVPPALAQHLLLHSGEQSVGSWVAAPNPGGGTLVALIARVPADASGEALGSAVAALREVVEQVAGWFGQG